MNSNSLSAVPTNSLNGPTSLKVLSLRNNHIPIVKSEAFAAQIGLEKIDLRNNRISQLEGNSFGQLTKVKEIFLAGNRLSRMNSDVFEGLKSLQKLDLSENFINNFPVVALKEIENVKVLNLSSNMIKMVDTTYFQSLKALQVLDLSRNGITSIPPGTFREQKALKFLDLSLNSLRTVRFIIKHKNLVAQCIFLTFRLKMMLWKDLILYKLLSLEITTFYSFLEVLLVVYQDYPTYTWTTIVLLLYPQTSWDQFNLRTSDTCPYLVMLFVNYQLAVSKCSRISYTWICLETLWLL